MSAIIVGTDGSSHSLGAVEWGMREAAVRDVPVTVVIVYQAAAGYWGGKPGYPEGDEPGRKALAAAQEQADKALSQLGVTRPPAVEVRAIHGIPVDELMKAAREADMLVVAARGSGGLARLLLDSVATQLSHHAPCPLVIIPQADAHR